MCDPTGCSYVVFPNRILQLVTVNYHILYLFISTDDEMLTCSGCGERFQYLYSLLAHSRFRCSILTEATKNRLSSEHPPKADDNDKHISLKRKLDSPIDVVGNKTAKENDVKEENNNVRDSNKTTATPSEADDRDVGSAFRKVAKTNTTRKYSESQEQVDAIKSIVDKREETKSESNNVSTSSIRQMYNPAVSLSGPISNAFPPGLGMLLPGWSSSRSVTQTFVDPRIYREVAARMPVMGKSNIFPSGINTNVPEVMRRFPGSDIMGKQLIMEQLRKSQLPRIPTVNPMVEKILQTTATPAMLQRPVQPLNLAQNWCAKCNASFRMTSDLVYHMRSHHKREFDPIKKKRDDKLQCDVCKETFKERHHLTRHMTSHT